MFINFWYPAEESDNITEQPMKVQMLGLWFVLWRDEDGKARCVANTCTHRGGSLGDGKVVGNCVQCPYHGWLFNGDGDCERIPSLGGTVLSVVIASTVLFELAGPVVTRRQLARAGELGAGEARRGRRLSRRRRGSGRRPSRRS